MWVLAHTPASLGKLIFLQQSVAQPLPPEQWIVAVFCHRTDDEMAFQEVIFSNRPISYSRYWTGTSCNGGLCGAIFSHANIFDVPPHEPPLQASSNSKPRIRNRPICSHVCFLAIWNQVISSCFTRQNAPGFQGIPGQLVKGFLRPVRHFQSGENP